VCRGFGIDRPVIQDREAVLAGQFEWLVTLCERGGYQAAGHVFCERYARAKRRGHRSQSAAAQEPPSRDRIDGPAPEQMIRVKRILGVKPVYAAL
jgi:hypothetical protein